MLKWLVTKSPNQSALESSVTDDPLAALRHTNKNNEPIYAISRINPLFKEDAEIISDQEKESSQSLENQHQFPESPPTDRESVRSSGYGSKENDSVSYKSDGQEDEDIYKDHVAFNDLQNNTKDSLTENINKEQNYIEIKHPRTVADIRKSFEVFSNPQLSLMKIDNNPYKIITANPKFVMDIEVSHSKPSSLQAIPEDSNESENGSISHKKLSWPRVSVSQLTHALQRQAERIYERRERERLKHKLNKKATNHNNSKFQVLRFNPLVSVVAQDRKYVTAITLSPPKRTQTQFDSKHGVNKIYSHEASSENFLLGATSSGIPSFMKTNKHNINIDHSLTLQPDSLITEDTLNMMNSPEYDINRRLDETIINENYYYQTELPNFGRAIYSNFSPSIRSGRSSQYSIDRKDENSKSLVRAKMNGVNVVKDLWEKSGLKTNGRKLLVNVNSLVNDETFGTENSSRIFHLPSNELQTNMQKSLGREKSNDSEELYEIIPSLTQTSSSSRSYNAQSYEDIRDHKRGIDNLGFINGKGNSLDSIASSSHSRHSYHFQHNLTEFQKLVSGRLQGEAYDRNSSTDFKKFTIENEINKNEKIETIQNTKRNKSYPGKAVRKLGLEDNCRHSTNRAYSDDVSNKPSGSRYNENGNNIGDSYGQRNRIQIWDQFHKHQKDDTFPGYFFRHPNSEAPIFAHQEGLSHDFTLDAKRSHRIMQRSSRSKRRRRCCRGFLVLFAFLFFIGTIIGLSWFSTGGEKLFGPMR